MSLPIDAIDFREKWPNQRRGVRNVARDPAMETMLREANERQAATDEVLLAQNELLLEQQAELRESNAALRGMNERLEAEVAERTRELGLERDTSVLACQAKSLFLANMSHELRTPLNAIIGYSEMLQEEASELALESFEADLGKIHRAGRHLLGLINDVLDLSKIEAGQMELFIEAVSVAQLADEVADVLAPLIAKSGNTLRLSLDAPLPVAMLDATKLRQCLLNLLSNANKFTDHGDVTLDVRPEAMDGQAWLTFRVSDTGVGIDPAQLDRIFEQFTQADASITRVYGGTGLGLAITRRFVEMMGGQIGVTSQPGVGSTFTIRLPLPSATEAL